jgi:hypothetical protein
VQTWFQAFDFNFNLYRTPRAPRRARALRYTMGKQSEALAAEAGAGGAGAGELVHLHAQTRIPACIAGSASLSLRRPRAIPAYRRRRRGSGASGQAW